MDIDRLIRTYFMLQAATCLAIYASTSLKTKFLVYGARGVHADEAKSDIPRESAKSPTDRPETDRLHNSSSSSATAKTDVPLSSDGPEAVVSLGPTPSGGLIPRSVENLINYQVPHSCFTYFYITSVFSSLFWGYQLLTRGSIIRYLCWLQYRMSGNEKAYMPKEQVILVWALMTLHGFRRLYESTTFGKSSKSTMSLGQLLVGIGFYVAVGLAVWIEGAHTILASKPFISSLELSPPSIKTMLWLPFFFLASGMQYDCHAYLASLPKYTLPIHPAFQLVVCPHYFAECVIYLSLMGIAAPPGTFINKAISSILMFVVTNLGVTAEGTHEWYVENFGAEKLIDRGIMIPYVW